MVIDPNEQVHSFLWLVFAKFDELGTLHAPLAWLVASDGRERRDLSYRCGIAHRHGM